MSPLSLIHWHIEPSSTCTLKCPRCPRAEVKESLLNKQLTLEFFQNQIGKNIIEGIKRITFCGNDGDPIYCNDLIEIIQWIKNINPSLNIVLITNGSYKKDEWWERLALVLNEYDEVNWSLDGWNQSSNEQYRINSDWDSIESGIATFNKFNTSTYKVWALIAFKFNENHISEVKKLAIEKNFDGFQTTLSTKFGSKYPQAYGDNDILEPNSSMIPKGHRFERNFELLSNKKRRTEDIKSIYKETIFKLKDENVTPRLCLIGNKGVFLNSQGEFYPCCWVATRYEHNSQWIELAKEKLNLHKRTFDEIINDDFWNNEFLKFDNLECRTKCSKNMLTNIDYMTEW
jgi:MoaA/NifB/PqqE/SkfB family radical SAM enzyme